MEAPYNLVIVFMERLGYVRKEWYEKVVKERDDLKRMVTELEAKIKGFEEERRKMEERVKNVKKSLELIEVADMPMETALGLIKKGVDFLLNTLREAGE